MNEFIFLTKHKHPKTKTEKEEDFNCLFLFIISKTPFILKLTTIKRTLGVVLFSFVASSSIAQDLIARQAPADRRMKDVHNVKIGSTLSTVNLANPAADIYADWDNGGVWNVSGYAPANMRIDLRGFAMPTTSRKVTSNYGPRWGRQHAGIDVKVYIGDTIYAAFDGKVRVVKNEGDRRGYGKYIVIRHPNGLETLYGHLSKQIVSEDQIVKAGEPIGLGGNTGRSTGSHLHFETRLAGKAINPAQMFDFEHQDIVSDFFTTRQAYGGTSAVASTTHRMEAEQRQTTADIAQANTKSKTTVKSSSRSSSRKATTRKKSRRRR